MKKLLKYAASSSIMDISIKHNKESFKFNLFSEIKISDINITKELKNQPSVYAWLTKLHKGLVKELSYLKIEEKKAYAKAYIKNKRQINPETNRPNSDDLAKQKAELDENYINAQSNVIEMQFNCSRIESAVRAFEQRKDILQTLSANRRKERE